MLKLVEPRMIRKNSNKSYLLKLCACWKTVLRKAPVNLHYKPKQSYRRDALIFYLQDKRAITAFKSHTSGCEGEFCTVLLHYKLRGVIAIIKKDKILLKYDRLNGHTLTCVLSTTLSLT